MRLLLRLQQAKHRDGESEASSGVSSSIHTQRAHSLTRLTSTLTPPLCCCQHAASLKNLLLGLHTSSWTSQTPSSSLTDPAYLPQPPASSSTPAPAAVANAEAATPPASGLTAAPVTVVATNTLPTALTSDASEVGGGKTIDYVGSVALLINNVTGGGMVWQTYCILILCFVLLAAVCTLLTLRPFLRCCCCCC
jgi:hypothetical protein